MVLICSKSITESLTVRSFCAQLNVCRQLSFIDLRGNCRREYREAVPIADVVLDNQDGAYPALLAADDGT